MNILENKKETSMINKSTIFLTIWALALTLVSISLWIKIQVGTKCFQEYIIADANLHSIVLGRVTISEARELAVIKEVILIREMGKTNAKLAIMNADLAVKNHNDTQSLTKILLELFKKMDEQKGKFSKEIQ